MEALVEIVERGPVLSYYPANGLADQLRQLPHDILALVAQHRERRTAKERRSVN